jgi:hypothetical protein
LDIGTCPCIVALMITSADDDYRDTKRVRIHGTPLAPPFNEVGEWIAARYGVHVWDTTNAVSIIASAGLRSLHCRDFSLALVRSSQ